MYKFFFAFWKLTTFLVSLLSAAVDGSDMAEMVISRLKKMFFKRFLDIVCLVYLSSIIVSAEEIIFSSFGSTMS